MSLRVLLVEDDRELRDALAVEGYDTVTAASLAEGLALLANLGKRPRCSPGWCPRRWRCWRCCSRCSAWARRRWAWPSAQSSRCGS